MMMLMIFCDQAAAVAPGEPALDEDDSFSEESDEAPEEDGEDGAAVEAKRQARELKLLKSRLSTLRDKVCTNISYLLFGKNEQLPVTPNSTFAFQLKRARSCSLAVTIMLLFINQLSLEFSWDCFNFGQSGIVYFQRMVANCPILY